MRIPEKTRIIEELFQGVTGLTIYTTCSFQWMGRQGGSAGKLLAHLDEMYQLPHYAKLIYNHAKAFAEEAFLWARGS